MAIESTEERAARLVDEPHGAANALRDVHDEDLLARRVADRVQNVGAHRHVPVAVRLQHEAPERRPRERPDLSSINRRSVRCSASGRREGAARSDAARGGRRAHRLAAERREDAELRDVLTQRVLDAERRDGVRPHDGLVIHCTPSRETRIRYGRVLMTSILSQSTT